MTRSTWPLLGLALCLGACSSSGSKRAAAVATTRARETVEAFLAAVRRGDRGGIRATLALAQLAKSTWPKETLPVSRNRAVRRFRREAAREIVAPAGLVHATLAATEIKSARSENGGVWVIGETKGQPIRFLVTRLDGGPQITSIE